MTEVTGISDLNELLRRMQPRLSRKDFVFCTVSEAEFNGMKLNPLSTFKEEEGVTAIIERKTADANSLAYHGVWKMITLTVHSDLSAIGFLARITNRLAREGISSNVVSAYYHDHLFVPAGKADKAMDALKKLSKT